MSQAKSQVQVSIVAQLGQGFTHAFTSADKRMQALSKTAQDLAKKVGNVDGFRKQQEAVKQAGYQWQAAKAKAEQFRDAIAAQGAPTRKQAADLAKLERATERAGGVFSQQRMKLAEMSRELQKAGVNVGKLSDEYKRLQGELGKANSKQESMERSLARQQRLVSGMATAWSKIQQHAAGAAAAGMVIGRAGGKALTYEEQLARLADTATAGEGAAAYGSSKSALSAAVQTALSAAKGGTREDVAAGLSTLIATGGMSTSKAAGMLPIVAQGAFASGATSPEIAGLALRMSGIGVGEKRGLEMAMRSGQLGGVELKDMARYLPEQIAAARSAGYSGEAGLAQILTMNQTALSTAGTPEQAANNVQNFLNKLASPELAKNVSKVTGTNFDQYALKAREKGEYKGDAFIDLADKQMMKDKKYADLKKKLERGGSSTERAAIMNDMAAIMDGSGMGQLIQDRQALAAALAFRFARTQKNDKGQPLVGSMISDTVNSSGVIDASVSRLGGENFAKVQVSKEKLNAANETAYNSISGPLGTVLTGFNSLTEMFPKLTAAAYGAVTALGAVAAWGVVGGAVGKVVGSGAGAAGAGAAAGAATGAASKGGMFGRLMKFGGPMVALASMANFTTSAEDATLAESSKKRQAIRDQYGESNVDAAFKAKKPWYIGHQDAASPRDLEGWVKSYMAEKDAAAKAAQAASEAVKAVQSRPNVTTNSTYNVTVTAPPGAGTAELAAQLEKTMRDMERRRESDARSMMFDKLGH